MKPSTELIELMDRVTAKAVKSRPSGILKMIRIFFATNGPEERRLCRDEVNLKLREVNKKLAEKVLAKFDSAANAGLSKYGTEFEKKLNALAARPQQIAPNVLRPLPLFQNGQAVRHRLTDLTGIVLMCLSAVTPEAFRSRHHIYSVRTEHGERRVPECDLIPLKSDQTRDSHDRF